MYNGSENYRYQEIEIKMVKEHHSQYATLNGPDAVDELFKPFFAGVDREKVMIACLDAKHKVVAVNTVSVGDISSSLVHPREVFKPAILCNAASIVLVHNHPSGDPTPSKEDIKSARAIKRASKLMGIRLLDFVIIGDGRSTSFQMAKLI